MAFLINHPFVCLDRKEPNYLSQHLICNRDSKLHYLNVNIEGCAPWGRDGTALSQSKGPSGLWHLPLPHACSWHLHSPPCLGHARGSGAALPAGLWPQHSASGSTTHSENSKGNFFLFHQGRLLRDLWKGVFGHATGWQRWRGARALWGAEGTRGPQNHAVGLAHFPTAKRCPP